MQPLVTILASPGRWAFSSLGFPIRGSAVEHFGQSKAAEKRFLCANSLRPLRFPAYCDQVSQCVDADEAALAELNVQLLIIEKGCAQEGAATGCQDTDGAVNHKPKHHLANRSIDPEKDMAVS